MTTEPHAPMPRTPLQAPPPITLVLDQLLTTEEPITIGAIVDRIDERGFGLLMLILGLPTFIPILPFGSPIVGSLYMLLALRLIIGMDRPWLPRFVRNKVLAPNTVETLRRRGLPIVRRVERFSRPRVPVLNSPVAIRAAAIVVFLMGLILLSPAPFLNTMPAVAVMLIGLGLLNDDGVFVLAGMALGVVAVGILIATVGFLIEVAQRFFPWWFR